MSARRRAKMVLDPRERESLEPWGDAPDEPVADALEGMRVYAALLALRRSVVAVVVLAVAFGGLAWALASRVVEYRASASLVLEGALTQQRPADVFVRQSRTYPIGLQSFLDQVYARLDKRSQPELRSVSASGRVQSRIVEITATASQPDVATGAVAAASEVFLESSARRREAMLQSEVERVSAIAARQLELMEQRGAELAAAQQGSSYPVERELNLLLSRTASARQRTLSTQYALERRLAQTDSRAALVGLDTSAATVRPFAWPAALGAAGLTAAVGGALALRKALGRSRVRSAADLDRLFPDVVVVSADRGVPEVSGHVGHLHPPATLRAEAVAVVEIDGSNGALAAFLAQRFAMDGPTLWVTEEESAPTGPNLSAARWSSLPDLLIDPTELRHIVVEWRNASVLHPDEAALGAVQASAAVVEVTSGVTSIASIRRVLAVLEAPAARTTLLVYPRGATECSAQDHDLPHRAEDHLVPSFTGVPR